VIFCGSEVEDFEVSRCSFGGRRHGNVLRRMPNQVMVLVIEVGRYVRKVAKIEEIVRDLGVVHFSERV
jgi:hypothetical protein